MLVSMQDLNFSRSLQHSHYSSCREYNLQSHTKSINKKNVDHMHLLICKTDQEQDKM